MGLRFYNRNNLFNFLFLLSYWMSVFWERRGGARALDRRGMVIATVIVHFGNIYLFCILIYCISRIVLS